MGNRKTKYIVALLGVVILVGALGTVAAQDQGEGLAAQPEAALAGTTAPLLQYQGRLTDPTSGKPVADGTYSLRFRLYEVATNGSHLWTETKSVPVKDGLFGTILGDTQALDHSFFDGRELWLGVKVGTDAEATPRQQILPVAYALGLVPGAEVSGNSTGPVLEVANAGTGDAISATGPVSVDGDLNVSGDLNGGTHTHAMLPIAFGVIDGDGTLKSGSGNVTSAWNATETEYRIAIAGESYWWTNYVTLVTPFCPDVTPVLTQLAGDLIVQIYDSSGKVQCGFNFVTFKP
jgi:hypothetical protein